MNQNYDYLFKLLIIGDTGVGKTCLLKRFTLLENSFKNDKFNFSNLNTIAIDFNTKMVAIDDKMANLRIWDTAGQERFRTITYSYYRDADGIIIVYDITNRKSFESIPNWLEDIAKYAKPNVAKLIVGNKSDLKERVVDYNTAKEYTDKVGIKLIETSAKDSINVERSFKLLLDEIIIKFQEKEWVEISAPINISKKRQKLNWADNCCC